LAHEGDGTLLVMAKAGIFARAWAEELAAQERESLDANVP
jgi:hypothetical protein